jgi:hypothetical protein
VPAAEVQEEFINVAVAPKLDSSPAIHYGAHSIRANIGIQVPVAERSAGLVCKVLELPRTLEVNLIDRPARWSSPGVNDRIDSVGADKRMGLHSLMIHIRSAGQRRQVNETPAAPGEVDFIDLVGYVASISGHGHSTSRLLA